jgi:hypothetical protein
VPRVISLLRGLQDLLAPTGAAGTRLEKADALVELSRILSAWDERESISELREMLEVAPDSRKANRRRTLRAVGQEMRIVSRLIEIAGAGIDVRTYKNAADALGDVDEKAVERAWGEWGDLRTHGMQVAAEHLPELSEWTTRTLALLPPVRGDRK